jgi:hypothetical protein
MSTTSTDKIKIGLGLVIALLLAVGILIFWPKTKIEKNEFYFHPDAVKQVEWQINGKKWITVRPDRATPWSPVSSGESATIAVDSPAMQNRLIALGSPDLEKMSAPSSGLKVRVGFGKDNFGEGIYDDGRFVWTEGLKKGLGFKASEQARNVLEEGQYAFNSHFWTWCTARPIKISARLENDKQFSVVNEKGQWYLSEEDGGSNKNKASTRTKIDATMLERWLGAHCTVKIDFFKDRANFTGLMKRLSEISNTAEWTIKFGSPGAAQSTVAASASVAKSETHTSEIEYVKKGQFWLVNDSMAIHSTQLDEALTSLATMASLAR